MELANKVEICSIGCSQLLDIDQKTHDQYHICYRYPECTIKFELSIDKCCDNRINTHSWGINYYDKLVNEEK